MAYKWYVCLDDGPDIKTEQQTFRPCQRGEHVECIETFIDPGTEGLDVELQYICDCECHPRGAER